MQTLQSTFHTHHQALLTQITDQQKQYEQAEQQHKDVIRMKEQCWDEERKLLCQQLLQLMKTQLLPDQSGSVKSANISSLSDTSALSDQLSSVVSELRQRTENYNSLQSAYNSLQSEHQLLKRKYDAVLSENTRLLAHQSVLSESTPGFSARTVSSSVVHSPVSAQPLDLNPVNEHSAILSERRLEGETAQHIPPTPE